MRLYIQEQNRLIKYNLPAKVDGSLLFSYKSYDTGIENSINIDSNQNNWILKSNGNVNIVGTNANVTEAVLSDYICIPVSTLGHPGYICMFCLPSIEEESLNLSTEKLNQITIGKSHDNNIVYHQNMMFDKHAIIFKNNDIWYVSPAVQNENCYLYLNSARITNPTPITVGDVIFMNGLKIVWMKSFFKLSMNKSLYEYAGLTPVNDNVLASNEDITEVSEAESNVSLYKDDEYFSHTPRIRSVLETKEVNVEAPPGKFVSNEEMPLILSLGTSLTMSAMSFMNIYSIYDNIVNKKMDVSTQVTGIITCSTMLISSLLIPILTKRWQKKSLKRKEAKRQEKYGEYLRKKEEEIQLILKKQSQIIFENYSDLTGCKNIIANRTRALWCREINDEDFINVRLGIGSRPALLKINAPEEKFSLEDDNLYQMVCSIKKKYERLQDIPITYSLKEEPVSALITVSKYNDAFINSIMLQLITYQSPLDLKLIIITDEKNADKWSYTRYLPHCWSDDKTTRYFASNQEDLKKLCQILDEEYVNRKTKKEEREQEQREKSKEAVEEHAIYDSYYLIITDNFLDLKNFKFTSDLLENQNNYGFSMLIIENDMKHLPKECQKFVCINDGESGIFSEKIKEDEMIKFNAEYDSTLDMRKLGNLVSNIPIQGKDAEQELPNMLPFLEMYNVGKIEQLNIRNRWTTSDPITTLQTPVGVHKNGELFKLDLHEKYDGPHGLIAGSTGSGKSEFIITYILSMAINYDPDEVQFVLIDYKGGGLAGAFENREQGISIPHLAGTITNLDTAEMNRTLVSIESELKRRQKKFNEEREKTGESTMDIYKYQRLYREGVIKEPISHLFIISDEFAELKSQQPDFMNQLISTARIGRSLGVHLILATQKPSGVVNDQIWSNSKFKVCLKVQSKSDSMEMLKRPEAASIKETGRFYLQVGYDEYFDIGQSAWSGERYTPVERIVKKIDDSIVFVNDSGETVKRINDAPKQEKSKVDNGDQLTNIVRYLQKIATDDGRSIKKLWLPSLAKNIYYNNLLAKYKIVLEEKGLQTIIGEYDAPSRQEQGPLIIDLLKNLLIYGQPGTGKENVITTIVYDLSLRKSPEEVTFYIGDFGAETLKTLRKIPQVGDVFVTEEQDKLLNLIKMLDKELERRKKEYSDYGGNYEEYCKLAGKKDNVIITALNNFESFTESYSRQQDAFNTLFRDGAKYGIVFIVTTTVSNVIRSRVAQSFENKICLKMPNDYDYRDLLGAPKGMIPVDNYGRGIVACEDKPALEFQTALICEKDQKTQFIRSIAEELKKTYSVKAKKIPVLPEVAYVDDVMHELKGLDCVPIGIEKNSLEVYVFNFMENKVNLIAAKSIRSHVYFIYALIKEMLTLEDVNVNIIDALSIYRGNYENIKLYNDNLDKAFEDAYTNVQNDATSKKKNVYFCLGISEFKNKISDKYKPYFEALFKETSKCKNNTFLFFDDANNYKKLQLENWYKDNVNNTFGIWLGEDVGTQIALGVMSLSLEDKQTLFPCIGYPIYQGQHMTIKYVVDGVDREDEE